MEKTLLQEVTALAGMSYKALKDRWRALYGTEPPAYKRQLMVRRLAYRIQELALGGLSESVKAQLERIATEDDFGSKGRKAGCRRREKNGPVAGTRLIREWRGRRYVVTALRDGYEYDSRKYRSLSAIAKAITGAHHSGPRFFGLAQSGKGASS